MRKTILVLMLRISLSLLSSGQKRGHRFNRLSTLSQNSYAENTGGEATPETQAQKLLETKMKNIAEKLRNHKIVKDAIEKQSCAAPDLDPLLSEIADNVCPSDSSSFGKETPSNQQAPPDMRTTVPPNIARALDRVRSNPVIQQRIQQLSTDASVSPPTTADVVDLEPIVAEIEETVSSMEPSPDPLPRPADIDFNYNSNPAISTTAQAHAMWGYVLRPGIDTAIDATAGNGGDATKLAYMLKLDQSGETNSRLICIDIQEQACQNTREKLEQMLGADKMDRVEIVKGSHAPLPVSPGQYSVGLVVFNLGFLPSSGDKQLQTKTDTTLAALRDATNVIRVGGLLSIMTYPGSNPTEHTVTKAYVEGLALLSSRMQDWREYIEQAVDGENWSRQLEQALDSVLQANGASQTWRVHEHRKLGWKDASTLYTAIRIK